MKKSPELLLPAGGLERMQTAFDFGADAVYAGSATPCAPATTNLPNWTCCNKASAKPTRAAKNSTSP